MTSKRERKNLASEWNKKNHTHFKHLNKADRSTRAKTFEIPMLRGLSHAEAKKHRDSQLVLLTKEIGGRSVTVADIMNKIDKQKELHVLVEGALGVNSINPRHYVQDLLASLVRQHKLLQQYENAESNYYSPRMKKRSTIARWRFVPNNNMAGRTLAEVRKLRVIRYCSKCLRDILNKI